MKEKPIASCSDLLGAASEQKTIALKNIFLHVTKACNLYCKYCYFSANKPLPDEMTTQDFTALWPNISMLRPHKVIFTGGEPLLRSDILDLIRGLREADPEHHILRCLNSNGHLVTPELVRELVGLVDEVRVSLDALTMRNDSLRGNGNFEAAVKAIETFYAIGFEPKVLVTVTSYSLPDLEELICFLVEKKITRINLNVFRPVGRGWGHQEWVANSDDVQAAVHRARARCYSDQHLPSDPSEHTMYSNCGVGSFLNIMPNGDVFPCHVLTNPEFRCGNVRKQSLIEICQHNGLLGDLQALDFHSMADHDERLMPLTQPCCMGEIYAQTKSLPIWRNNLPLLYS